MKTAGINREMAMDATDLTQLSSREQLSALMDGALPADETRFLLRRLQHDASLAECWERWRLSAEVMRGLAPAQRLPADFAARVAASLQGKDLHGEVMPHSVASSKRLMHAPAWLRWGGGAAVAASLAVVAFMASPVIVDSNKTVQGRSSVAAATAPSLSGNAVAQLPAPKAPAPQPPSQDPAGAGIESQAVALASAVAAVARPIRNSRRASQVPAIQATSMAPAVSDARPVEVAIAAHSIQPLLPQADIITRPWPRSVLPQYGNAGITVGFGDSVRNVALYNPFQLRTRIGNLPPPTLIGRPSEQGDTPAARERTKDGQNGVSSNAAPPQS